MMIRFKIFLNLKLNLLKLYPANIPTINVKIVTSPETRLGTRQLGGKGLPCWKRPDKVELLRQNRTGVIHASKALSENV